MNARERRAAHLDRKVLHKMIHFQATIMGALHKTATDPTIITQLEQRMLEALRLMEEINNELSLENVELKREVSELETQAMAGAESVTKN